MSSVGPRQLFRHGSVYALTSLVTAAMSFAVLPIYAHVLGSTGMGLVEVLAVSGEVLAFVVAQGLGGAWFRLRFNYEGEARRGFESTVLWYVLASSAAVLVLLYFVGPGLARHITPATPYYPLWFFTALGACALTFGDLYALRLQADQRSLPYAVFSILRRAFALGMILFFVVALRAGVAGKVQGEALALSLIALVAWLLMRPKLFNHEARGTLSSVLAYSIPLLPHAIALQVISSADRFVLTRTLGLAAVGVYAMGFRIARVMETINVGMGTAYRTIFTERVKRFESAQRAGANATSPQQLDELARLGLLVIAAAALLCQAISAAAYDALLILLPRGREFADSWRVVPILCSGLLAHAAYQVLVQPVVYVPAMVRKMPIMSGAGAITNLLACLLLIPLLGLQGAAWSNLVGWSVMAACAFFVGGSVLRIAHRWSAWWALFVLTAGALLGFYWLDLHVSSPLTRVAAKLALLALSSGATWLLVRGSVGAGEPHP